MDLYRPEKLHPWYRQELPRCDATTLAQLRCIFSARFTNETNTVNLCKVHADMADFKTKPIRERRINLL